MKKLLTFLGAFLLFVSSRTLTAGDPIAGYSLPPQYVLDQIKGTVLVKAKDSAKPEPAEEEQTVQAGDEIITQAGSEATLTLNQTTMFHLSENTDLQVSDLDSAQPGSFITHLKLAAGRILAQVEKLTQSHSVFEIESGGVICGVRGTAFEVQKDGSLVQANTFEGTVVMSKGGLSQQVKAGRHSEFASDRGAFLEQRAVNDREKARFQNWQRFQQLSSRRQKERQEAVKAFNRLPDTEKKLLWEKLQQVKGKDRLNTIRRMMREKNSQDRLKVIEESSQNRQKAMNEREETIQKAAKEREKELKARKKKEQVP